MLNCVACDLEAYTVSCCFESSAECNPSKLKRVLCLAPFSEAKKVEQVP